MEYAVLVGTRKGAFVLTSDGKRERWDVSGPHFGGWEIYHVKGSPADPESALRVAVERLVRPDDPALERRRQDVGAGRQQVRLRRRARHAPVVRRHAASVGVQARVASRAVADRSRHGLRRRRRCRAVPHDRRRAELGGAARACAATAPARTGSRARAGCACTRSCSIPANPQRMFIAISAAGAFRTDDGGTTWQADQPAACVRSTFPTRMPKSDTACTASRCTRRGPDVLFMQKHWDVMRSDDARRLVARGQRQPADRLRLRDRRARARAGNHLRRPDQERLRALSAGRQAARVSQPHRRQRVGGADQGPAAAGLLRQRAARRDGGRFARSLRHLLRHDRRPGLRVGGRRGQLGRRSCAICRRCCRSRSRRCHDPRRSVSGSGGAAARICGRWRASSGEVQLAGPWAARRSARVLDALEAAYPVLRGTIRDHDTQQRRPFVRFFACEHDLSHEQPDTPLPMPWRPGRSRSWSSARWRADRGRVPGSGFRVRGFGFRVPSSGFRVQGSVTEAAAPKLRTAAWERRRSSGPGAPKLRTDAWERRRVTPC